MNLKSLTKIKPDDLATWAAIAALMPEALRPKYFRDEAAAFLGTTRDTLISRERAGTLVPDGTVGDRGDVFYYLPTLVAAKLRPPKRGRPPKATP